MTRYVIKRGDAPDKLARYRAELNEEQFQVATANPGAALVVAGAGSGKTRATTYRVAFLIEQGVSPARVMLATFTNRAAREMLRRVELLTSGEVPPELYDIGSLEEEGVTISIAAGEEDGGRGVYKLRVHRWERRHLCLQACVSTLSEFALARSCRQGCLRSQQCVRSQRSVFRDEMNNYDES